MKRILPIILIYVFSAMLISCEKAPRYAIGESDMEDLLVDIYKAEAYIESHYTDFADDSSKMLFKQSVFMKHGVTAEKFDTSLAWYAKNLTVYMDVYENVQKRLEKERENLAVSTGSVVENNAMGRAGKMYKNFGDSADLWTSARQLLLAENMEYSILPFELTTNQESQKGDKYSLKMRLTHNKTEIKALVALQYGDDSYTFVERNSASDGWLDVTVQGDSLKTIKNVFGYIKCGRIKQGDIVYVDSILLLRTHLDRSSYSRIAMQKVLDRRKVTDEEKMNDNSASAEEKQSTSETQPQQPLSGRTQRPMMRRRNDANSQEQTTVHDVKIQSK